MEGIIFLGNEEFIDSEERELPFEDLLLNDASLEAVITGQTLSTATACYP